MRIAQAAAVTFALVLPVLFGGSAHAQTIQFSAQEVGLKSGETTEYSDVFYINTNCKSVLTATPEVEIMDGPPGVTAAINPAQVVPAGYSCSKPVAGGKLVISAKDVADYSYTRMVLRINYKTTTGPRQRTVNVNVSLFPAN